MSSSILHSCPCCGQVTDISNALAAFIQNPYCSQCGLSASESDLELQDDLAALFEKRMSIGVPFPPEEDQGVQHPPIASPEMYSISQHYHHSAHLVRENATRPSTEGTNGAISETLRQHNVDPSTLSPKQMELFEHAMPEQQSRLIQIWQISSEHSYATTSSVVGRNQSDLGTADVASTVAIVSTPFGWTTRSGDREMCDVPVRSESEDDVHQYAEPYMVTGYETMPQRSNGLSASQPTHIVAEPTTGSPYKLASDPIYYAQGRRWWESTQPGLMEYQYGLFDEMNRHSHCGLLHHRQAD
ncbi:hypothetical protein BO94DRAFT_197308 [Aspergillus sclerotioniger CBS 115572]|uniref:Uncharacterized protein n=1 Tax=Aspergillus sclerotioniger CBS 115572 TaxID=1450535 RepID=A0A317VPP1_9EURO|nr:hypothetical protein BO94DRAFT_197308 [Aspergillus sclerotioniger CBS 115572]PWY76344.1 hypothetical protein BO94DRAFT_197308 [Aspergillus sclerotioniger CBS 115572]